MSRQITQEEFLKLPVGSLVTREVSPHKNPYLIVQDHMYMYDFFVIASKPYFYDTKAEALQGLLMFDYYSPHLVGETCNKGSFFVDDLFGKGYVKVYLEGEE